MKTLLVLILSLFSSQLLAEVYCEKFSHSELKTHYHANFMDRAYRGCFETFFQGNNQGSSLAGGFSIFIGNNSQTINSANIAKITFAAFTAIAQNQSSAKKLSGDADAVLNSIRYEAQMNAERISTNISEFRNVFSSEALPLIKDHSNQIAIDIKTLESKIGNLKKVSASLGLNGTVAPGTPALGEVAPNVSSGTDPLKKEKERWSTLTNGHSIPFHTIEKIYKKNPELGNQLLNEVKTARYMQAGLVKPSSLPLLNSVSVYESKTVSFDLKYKNARKSLSKEDSYYEQKNFALTSARELKVLSEKKLVQGDLAKADESLDMATLALEVATSLPVAATGRGLYEFFSGKSLLTGKDLSQFERGVSLSMALIDLTPAAWLAKGVKGVWAVGELGTRLVERGLVKAGFEESLNLGVHYAGEIGKGLNELVSSGAVKLETVKHIVEHKVFFNNLTEEAYLTSKLFQKDVIQFEKTFGEISLATEKYGWSQAEKDSLYDVYTKAPNAKFETDKVAEEIAESVGGKVAKAPLKSPGRAVEKITVDYGKDAFAIKDIVRNTIIAEEQSIPKVTYALEQKGAKIKILDAASDPLGYSGINSTFITTEGFKTEIQVNSPAMIYAKEEESIARILLGDETYNELSTQIKIPGGKGHDFYEQWRSLPKDSPEANAIAIQSKEYYDSIRRAVSNGHH